MNVLYSDQGLFDGKTKSIFLAGPTPRSSEVESWRPHAIEILRKFGFKGTVLVPESSDGIFKGEYLDQVNWEYAGLNNATVIVFWVPREMKTMVGLTTNCELGYWLAKTPEKCLYGRPDGAPSTRYLDWLFRKEKALFKKSSYLSGTHDPSNDIERLLLSAFYLSAVADAFVK